MILKYFGHLGGHFGWYENLPGLYHILYDIKVLSRMQQKLALVKLVLYTKHI